MSILMVIINGPVIDASGSVVPSSTQAQTAFIHFPTSRTTTCLLLFNIYLRFYEYVNHSLKLVQATVTLFINIINAIALTDMSFLRL